MNSKWRYLTSYMNLLADLLILPQKSEVYWLLEKTPNFYKCDITLYLIKGNENAKQSDCDREGGKKGRKMPYLKMGGCRKRYKLRKMYLGKEINCLKMSHHTFPFIWFLDFLRSKLPMHWWQVMWTWSHGVGILEPFWCEGLQCILPPPLPPLITQQMSFLSVPCVYAVQCHSLVHIAHLCVGRGSPVPIIFQRQHCLMKTEKW